MPYRADRLRRRSRSARPAVRATTLLAEVPWSYGSERFAGFGPHLHALARSWHPAPGLGGPDDEVRARQADPRGAASAGSGGSWMPAAPDVDAGCEAAFHLDAVAWAEGSPFTVRPFVDPLIEGAPVDWLTVNEADASGPRWSGRTASSLRPALLRPETLAKLDAHAARKIRRADPAAFVWYVRGLRPAAAGAGRPPTLVWGVVDDTTVRVLAHGDERPSAPAARRVGPHRPRPRSHPVGDPAPGERQRHDARAAPGPAAASSCPATAGRRRRPSRTRRGR